MLPRQSDFLRDHGSFHACRSPMKSFHVAVTQSQKIISGGCTLSQYFKSSIRRYALLSKVF